MWPSHATARALAAVLLVTMPAARRRLGVIGVCTRL